MKKHHIVLLLALIVAGCASNKYYTGHSTTYYNEKGELVECREPEPIKGGNCKLSTEWKKPILRVTL